MIFFRDGAFFSPPTYLRNYDSYDNETCTASQLIKGDPKIASVKFYSLYLLTGNQEQGEY